MLKLRISRDESGAAAVEMAFAIPILIVMIWAFVQLAQVYRAVAGIQQALGEGARYATLCLSQSATGCTAPTAAQIKTKINSSVYGIGPGTFTVADPVAGSSGTGLPPCKKVKSGLCALRYRNFRRCCAASTWSHNYRSPRR